LLASRDLANDGRSDEEQLAAASSEGRAILTANVGHFAVIHREMLRIGTHHSGVLIRRQSLTPGEVARAASNLNASLAEGTLEDRFEFLSSWLHG
jgi:hypothetical protein